VPVGSVPEPDSLEAFVELARGVVEQDALRHAEDRWWILSPLLVCQRGGFDIEVRDIAALEGAAARAVGRGELEALPTAVGAARVAVALHVDLALEEEIFAAIVLAVVGRLASACQYAPVERTDAGTPRLGAWRPGPGLEAEVSAALRRASGPPASG
jgi:hypothetical protein